MGKNMKKKTLSFFLLGIILSSSSLPTLGATINDSSVKNTGTASSLTVPTKSTKKSELTSLKTPNQLQQKVSNEESGNYESKVNQLTDEGNTPNETVSTENVKDDIEESTTVTDSTKKESVISEDTLDDSKSRLGKIQENTVAPIDEKVSEDNLIPDPGLKKLINLELKQSLDTNINQEMLDMVVELGESTIANEVIEINDYTNLDKAHNLKKISFQNQSDIKFNNPNDFVLKLNALDNLNEIDFGSTFTQSDINAYSTLRNPTLKKITLPLIKGGDYSSYDKILETTIIEYTYEEFKDSVKGDAFKYALGDSVALEPYLILPNGVEFDYDNATMLGATSIKWEFNNGLLEYTGNFEPLKGNVEMLLPVKGENSQNLFFESKQGLSVVYPFSAKEVDNSKTFGTAPWSLWGNGELHIGSGEFANPAYNPWKDNKELENSIKKIVIDGDVKANSDSSNLFSNLPYLESIEGLEKIDTSQVKDMSNMFYQDVKLNGELSIGNWDTSTVEDMSGLFDHMTSFSTNLKIGGWDTSSVKDFNMIFNYMNSLETLNLENWDTSGATDMSGMFSATGIKELNINKWNINNVTTISKMFQDTKLKELDLSNWDTSSVVDMGSTFVASFFENLDVSNWDTSNVKTMEAMFSSNPKLTSLDLSSFDTSKVTNMGYMFANTGFEELDVTMFDTSKVTDMSSMFANDGSLESLDLSNWDTSSLKLLDEMFDEDTKLASIKMGNNSIFKSFSKLPAIDTSTGVYTGRWIGVNTQQKYDSSDLFMDGYDGSIPDTYVWETFKKVTAKYQDEKGNELSPDKVLKGTLNENYQTEKLTIPNYSFKEVKGNESGKFTEDDQVVTYIYERTDAAPVTVKYEDESGEELAKSEELTGKISLPYKSQEKTIKGYTLKETPTNANGIFSEKAQTVTYIYTKDPVQGADVTIHYQDEKGKEIAPAVTLTGNVGDTFTSKQETIKGYTFKEVKGNATGVFSDQAQTVTYLYKKVANIPDSHNNNSNIKKEVTHKTQNTNQNLLPTTGDNNLKFLVELLVGSILVFLSGAFLRTKRINKRK